MPKKSLRAQVRDGEIDSQRAVVMALNHPLRVKLLTILSERTASPSKLVEELGEPLSTVAYHSRVLDELGQIEIVEEQPVRGATEHFFRAINRPLFHNPDWEKFNPKVRGAVSVFGIDAISKDLAVSLAAETFDARTDRHLSRTPMLLDEQGWTEANAIHDTALQDLLDVQARAHARMNGSTDPGIHTVSAMACFEMPLPSEPSK